MIIALTNSIKVYKEVGSQYIIVDIPKGFIVEIINNDELHISPNLQDFCKNRYKIYYAIKIKDINGIDVSNIMQKYKHTLKAYNTKICNQVKTAKFITKFFYSFSIIPVCYGIYNLMNNGPLHITIASLSSIIVATWLSFSAYYDVAKSRKNKNKLLCKYENEFSKEVKIYLH